MPLLKQQWSLAKERLNFLYVVAAVCGVLESMAGVKRDS